MGQSLLLFCVNALAAHHQMSKFVSEVESSPIRRSEAACYGHRVVVVGPAREPMKTPVLRELNDDAVVVFQRPRHAFNRGLP